MIEPNILPAALKYAAFGLSVIPVFPADHSARPKQPCSPWKTFQDRIAKPEEIRGFFHNKTQRAVAVIAGYVSGNLELIDFDKPELFPPFMGTLRENDPLLADRLIMQETPSGGFHLLYRCTDPVPGNQKLAMSHRYQDESGKTRQDVFIETRGEGGYFLIAPSRGYYLQGNLENIPIISGQERDVLISLAKGFDEAQEPERQQPKNGPTGEAGVRPGDVFEHLADWRQLLEADGWKYIKTIGDRDHYVRPGKDQAETGATVNERGLFVFSSSTCLPCKTPLGKFAYIAKFRFSDDWKAATRYVVETYPAHFSKKKPANRLSHQDEPPWPDDSANSANSANSAFVGQVSLSQSGSASISQHQPVSAQSVSREKNLSREVISFIESDPAPFSNNDLYSELCVRSPDQKKAIRNALDYQEKQGKIRRIDGKRGQWEIVESRPEEMDLLTADTEPFKISLPLEISDFVTVRPGGIILVSGSSNAGKTVFLLTVVRNLLADTNINPNLNPSFLRKREEGLKNLLYLNSEMSRQELVARIRSFGDDPADWVKHVSFVERSHSFDRVVNPDGINLIDFLEVNEDFYMAGKLIADIHRQLQAGIAIIAMQKKQGQEYAKGGEMTLEKPRLAINLDKNEPHGFTCKITKAKEAVNFTRNIQGMTRDFVINGNSKILPLSDWRFVNEKQRQAINNDYLRSRLPQKIMMGDRNQNLWPSQSSNEI